MKKAHNAKRVVIPVLILIAGTAAWWFLLRGPASADGIISLSGRIESDDAAVEQAEAKIKQARQQIAVLQAQLEQGRLTVGQARLDAEGRVSQAQAQLA